MLPADVAFSQPANVDARQAAGLRRRGPTAPTRLRLHRRRHAVPDDPDRIGNYYTTAVQRRLGRRPANRRRLKQLEKRTVAFISDFCAADLPAAVKEAALNNTSTLRSPTCFRTPDWHLFGWEGAPRSRRLLPRARARTCGITSRRPRTSTARSRAACAK